MPERLCAVAWHNKLTPLPPVLPCRSKSDDEFLEGLGVEFVWGAEGVDVGELNDLFEKVTRELLLAIKLCWLVSPEVESWTTGFTAGWCALGELPACRQPMSPACLAPSKKCHAHPPAPLLTVHFPPAPPRQVGFPRRDPGRLTLALANTYRTVWVRAARKSRVAKQGQVRRWRGLPGEAANNMIWEQTIR